MELGLEGFGGDELQQRNSGGSGHWRCPFSRRDWRLRKRGREEKEEEDDNPEAKCGRFQAQQEVGKRVSFDWVRG